MADATVCLRGVLALLGLYSADVALLLCALIGLLICGYAFLRARRNKAGRKIRE